MDKKIKDINIYLGGELITRDDLAVALRMIADVIENGCVGGIVGWSTISWDIELGEEDESEEN